MQTVSQAIKRNIKRNYIVFKGIRLGLSRLGYWEKKLRNLSVDNHWQERIACVKECSDNTKLNPVPNAGQIVKDTQVMHNGLLIHIGSYYGWGNTKLLLENKGIHEPQEERVFAEVLKTIPKGATMIELGAFWAFYSMWFNKEIQGAQSYMIEPDEDALLSGQNNFRLNRLKGYFTNAFIGKESIQNGQMAPTICIDDFVQENQIPFVHILHSDIQGFELEMLQGSVRTIKQGKIGYFFISTHSNELHYQCISFLENRGFVIVASADLNQTYSWDGLIVARYKLYSGLNDVKIALKKD